MITPRTIPPKLTVPVRDNAPPAIDPIRRTLLTLKDLITKYHRCDCVKR